MLEFGFNLNQWCSGVGTREKGVPTPLFWHYTAGYKGKMLSNKQVLLSRRRPPFQRQNGVVH